MKTRVRVYRQVSDLTQAQLADRVGCSERTIWRIEQDPARTDPPLSLCRRIADHFQTPLGDLFSPEPRP